MSGVMEPTCARCRTAEYLKIEKFEPGYFNERTFRTAQSTINKKEWVGPVASFFCQKCGSFNGHTVPDGWAPFADPDISKLKESGTYYSAPGRKNVRNSNGAWTMTM